MKYKLAILAALCAAPFSAMAAGTGFYAGVTGGLGFPNDLESQLAPGFTLTYDSNVNYAFGIFAGKEFGNFRAELEYMYRHNNPDITVNGETSNAEIPYSSGMVNGYYDWKDRFAQITPYVGGGVGFINGDPHDFRTPSLTLIGKSDTSFAYQLMTGINAAVTEKISIGIGYRFVQAPGDEEAFANTHETYATVAFKF